MFFPHKRYTYHLPYSAEQARYLLEAVTEKNRFLPEKYQKDDELKQLLKFNGDVGERRFAISQRVRQGQHFLPLIKGKIVDSGKGTLIETEYQLFFGSKLLFMLWSIVSLALAVIFFIKGLHGYSVAAFVFFVLNFAVGFYSFFMHVKKCKGILEDVFTIQ